MAQVVIRNLDGVAVARLRARATRHGRSLEGELRAILSEASRDRDDDVQRARAFRARLTGRRRSDSTALIRRDRDR
jgi:antitoxin FitA